MRIEEVKSKKQISDFHRLPFDIYANYPQWIPHLQQDVEKVFTPSKNKFWEHGEACRWVLYDTNHNVIGRVAAFINRKVSDTFKQPTGGMGFFECIENQNAAFVLLDQCKFWLEERGMEAMDGPINFGEKDKFWGLLIENFEDSPYYGQNFNPPYYIRYFEAYGFQVYYNQFVFHRDYHTQLQPKFQERADRFAENPDYSVVKIDKSKLPKFAEDFRTIYNRAWVTHDGFKSMSKEQAMRLMKQMKPVIDPNTIFFVYHLKKPVAFYVSLPELNQIFKYVGGNLNWWGKMKFLWYFKVMKVVNTSFGVAFGIDPDYQSKGLEGVMFREYEKAIRPFPERYKNLIITWIGDFNPKMIRIIEFLGGKKFRTLATYRKLFNPNSIFERSPIIDGKKQG